VVLLWIEDGTGYGHWEVQALEVVNGVLEHVAH
jgi:hypothetical protein